MISDQKHINALATAEFTLPNNHTVNRVLVFIKEELPEFETICKQSNIPIHKEDDISKELSRYFNDKARSQNLFFQFNEKKGVDFTIYVTPYVMGVLPLFMIEAKRLSKKHRDYVFGPTGGMERIKREQEDFGNHLTQAAMIGYIQDENQEFWRNKINGWIDDLIKKETDIDWIEEDKIIPNDEISNFISRHSRKSKEKITICHFWINLN